MVVVNNNGEEQEQLQHAVKMFAVTEKQEYEQFWNIMILNVADQIGKFLH